MDEHRLRNCPFCGGAVIMEKDAKGYDHKVYHKSIDDAATCPVLEPFTVDLQDREDAIAMWNRRWPE